MRILFVTPEYITELYFDGGLANYLHRISLGLVEAGHEPIIMVASDRDETFYHKGIRVNRVDSRKPCLSRLNRLTFHLLSIPLNWLWQSWVLNRATKKLHQASPLDLIQYASYTATGFFRLRNVPAVVRVSSYEPLWRIANDERRSFSMLCLESLERWAFRRADGIFGPSRIVAEAVKRSTDRPVEVIESPFVLDVDTFDDSQYQKSLAGKDYLLFFGTLGKYKGVLSIAEMLQPLLSRYPNLFFVFVGKDLIYEGRSVMNHVWNKAGSCRPRVLYLGKLRHEQLYPILQNAHAVVLPSLVDNFPNTCLEAMAFGKVVVGTRGTSFEQLLEDGVSGFLCTPDDSEDLLEKVGGVLALDETMLRKISIAAKERIALNSTEKIVQVLTNFYRSIIDAKLLEGGGQ